MDLPRLQDVETVYASLQDHRPCYSCGLKEQELEQEEVQSIPRGFSQYGVDYHTHDFIYLKPGGSDLVYDVAQIVKIRGIPDSPRITVRYCGRHDVFCRQQKQRSKTQTAASDLPFDNVGTFGAFFSFYFEKRIPLALFIYAIRDHGHLC